MDYYSYLFRKPFASDIPFQSWFEGDVGGTEAQELLLGQKPGTFLVRFSSQVGAYAVSVVDVDMNITHSLIQHEGVPGNGYQVRREESKAI